ncbi:ankyrin repeat domain-containing protein [Micromonospora sp. A200]|uniref:ankyrin repeat domain-containing protein n=1 Tax=Micromonospora sp. A200 TaxID=2940568 RepID=UPI002476C0F9|nr:ankyrin repeat domain-containing protein [Micromonospora sp. A200]
MPTDDRSEALLDAVTSRDADGIVRLLAAGADPRGRDGEGVPLLRHAADTGDVALVRPFLDAGAPVDLADQYGVTPLMCAVMAGAPAAELVDLLVACGVDVNSHGDPDEDGHTVLTRALETPAEPIIAALLAAGADPNAARGDGWTPPMLAAQDGPPATVPAAARRRR